MTGKSWLEQWLCPRCKEQVIGTLQVVLALAKEHVCPPFSVGHVTTSEMPSWSFNLGGNVNDVDPDANNYDVH